MNDKNANSLNFKLTDKEGHLQFHQALAVYRQRSHLSQEQLARHLGLKSDRMLRMWESGSSVPKPERMGQLIEVFFTLQAFNEDNIMEEATRLWESVKDQFEAGQNNKKPYPPFDADWFNKFQHLSTSTKLTSKDKRTFPVINQEVAKPLHNLPTRLTSFIGRTAELDELERLLQVQGKRLITLSGAGGTGKSRLALEVASEQLDRFSGGVWFVELGPLTQPELVIESVARVLVIDQNSGQPLIDQLITFLQSQTLLIILDNCEHLISESARLAEYLLSRCAGLHILATSREPLNIIGEWVVRVPSLALPQLNRISPFEDLTRYEAIRLFVERACAAAPDFELTGQNARSVVEICTTLDGIPLALELAAASLRGIGVNQLAQRLTKSLASRFKFLANGNRAAVPRQQTLEALIDWSFSLLTDREQIVFRRLAVFADDWSLEAAEAICGSAGAIQNSTPLTSFDSLELEAASLLAQLVNKSLVQLDQTTGRYNMLETIRLFALQKLAESGDSEFVARQHFNWYLNFAQEGSSAIGSSIQPEWFEKLEMEHDNFRAALAWAIGKGMAEEAGKLGLSLWKFWQNQIYFSEAVRWLEQVLAVATPQISLPYSLRTSIYNALGVISNNRFQFEKAQLYHAEALRMSQELEDNSGIAAALLGRGWQRFNEMELQQAIEYASESLALARRLDDKNLIGAALILYSVSAIELGVLKGLRPAIDESLKIWREAGSPSNVAASLVCLAALEQRLHNREAAKGFLVEAIHLQIEFKDYLGLIGSLTNMLKLSLNASEQPAGAIQAARVLGVIDSWEKRIVEHQSKWSIVMENENNRKIKAIVDEATFTREFAIGKELTLAEILSLANEITVPDQKDRLVNLTRLPAVSSSQSGLASQDAGRVSIPDGLSAREMEVLRLVATGLSNNEIAQRLVVSPSTIEAHLRSIFAKIEVTSRSAATRYALEHGLN